MTNPVHQSNSIAIPLFVLFLITSISALTGSLMLIPNKENIILYFLLFILLILIVLSIFVFIKSRCNEGNYKEFGSWANSSDR